MEKKNKYLKYKKKYLQLKILKGGTIETLMHFIEITNLLILTNYENCAFILNYFCPDDVEYKNKINNFSINRDELIEITQKIKNIISDGLDERDKKSENFNIAQRRLLKIAETYFNEVIRKSGIEKKETSQVATSSSIPNKNINEVITDLTKIFPHLLPERYFNTEYIVFDVIGDGRCGFYSAILSSIILIARNENKLTLNENTNQFFYNVINMNKFDPATVIDFLSKLDIPDDRVLTGIDLASYEKDKEDILLKKDNRNNYSETIIKNIMELNFPDLNIVFLTDTSREINSRQDKLNIFIFYSDGHFKFLLSKNDAEFLIDDCKNDKPICKIFKYHDFVKSKRHIETKEKGRRLEIELSKNDYEKGMNIDTIIDNYSLTGESLLEDEIDYITKSTQIDYVEIIKNNSADNTLSQLIKLCRFDVDNLTVGNLILHFNKIFETIKKSNKERHEQCIAIDTLISKFSTMVINNEKMYKKYFNFAIGNEYDANSLELKTLKKMKEYCQDISSSSLEVSVKSKAFQKPEMPVVSSSSKVFNTFTNISNHFLDELKNKYPKTTPEIFERFVKINVIGDGLCGFYASYFSAFLLLSRKDPDHKLVTNIIEMSKFDTKNLTDLISNSVLDININEIPNETGHVQKNELKDLFKKKMKGSYHQDTLSIFFKKVYDIEIVVFTKLSDAFELLEPPPEVNRIYIFQSGIHFQSLITNVDLEFLLFENNKLSTKAKEMIKYNNDNIPR